MIYKLPRWVLYGSMMLAFNAGMVNATALLGFANLSVSHVTGTVTVISTAFEASDYAKWLHGLMVVLSFLIGSILSGLIVRNEPLQPGRRYGWALLLEAGLLGLACVFFIRQSYVGELLASMACGLQNSMIATYSGSVIRTTHLTGLLSDIGATLGNWIGGRPFKRLQFYLQIGICVAFFWGGVLGAWLFRMAGGWSLLACSVLVLAAALGYFGLQSSQYQHRNFD